MKETTWKTYAQKVGQAAVPKIMHSSPTSSVCAEYLTKPICHESGYGEFLTAFVIAVMYASPNLQITVTRVRNYGMC